MGGRERLAEVSEQFKRDVQEHALTILRDDGLYRHLRFKRPGTMTCYFDLVTWPGHLAYVGDMGDYVFTRVEDMLTFFRGHTPSPPDIPEWRSVHDAWAPKSPCRTPDEGTP